MPNPGLSILVVDDAKFSSAMIGRALAQAGYRDVRFAASALDALAQLEARPASVLLADWLMPEVDGLELTARVRQQDERIDHYTYIILLTGREGDQALAQAFDQGVDDFISKTVMNEQLVPRVFAAERLCGTLQRLLQEKRRLTASLEELEQNSLIDPLTGAGNHRHLLLRLGTALRQIESRGHALCYLLIGLPEMEAVRKRHGQTIHDELYRAIAKRLQQLVRPMDMLFRIDDNHFALLLLLDNLQDCTPSAFKRLHENLNLKPFRTRDGFVSLKAGIALVALDARALPLDPQHLIQQAAQLLPTAYETGRIVPQRLPLPQHGA